jgi:hypothetical protein
VVVADGVVWPAVGVGLASVLFFLENGRHVFSRLTVSSSWRKWSPWANRRALPPMLVSPLYVAVCLELLMAKVVAMCPIDDTRRRGPSPDMAPLCPGRRV